MSVLDQIDRKNERFNFKLQLNQQDKYLNIRHSENGHPGCQNLRAFFEARQHHLSPSPFIPRLPTLITTMSLQLLSFLLSSGVLSPYIRSSFLVLPIVEARVMESKSNSINAGKWYLCCIVNICPMLSQVRIHFFPLS